jgi:hypothetical protein
MFETADEPERNEELSTFFDELGVWLNAVCTLSYTWHPNSQTYTVAVTISVLPFTALERIAYLDRY